MNKSIERKYKSYRYDSKMINEIYQAFIKHIDFHKCIIDENDSVFLTNNYSKIDNISNLPKNEQDAYLYLWNMNQIIMIADLVLEYNFNYFVINLNYQRNYYKNNLKEKQRLSMFVLKSTYDTVHVIYNSYIYLKHIQKILDLKDYNPNMTKLYDSINNIIETYINNYPECKYNFKIAEKKMNKILKGNIFKKLKLWCFKQYIMFKSYCIWLFEDLSVQYVDVLNKYTKYPIDEHREFYGKIYEKTKDSLNYAIEKYNNPEIINLFQSYKEKSFIKRFFSEKGQKILSKNIDELTDEDYSILDKELDDSVNQLTKDSYNINVTMHNSIEELYKFNIRNIADLCYGYIAFKNK